MKGGFQIQHNHESGATLGKHSPDLILRGELAGIGFPDAFVDVTNLPGLTSHVVAQRIDGGAACGGCSCLGQRVDLVVDRLNPTQRSARIRAWLGGQAFNLWTGLLFVCVPQTHLEPLIAM